LRYQLSPTVLRKPDIAKREGYLSVEFRRRAKSTLKQIDSNFEWLCAMQHYGIPTRLLDWSESLATAMYFAAGPTTLDDLIGTPIPTVWMLDPFSLAAEKSGANQVGIIPISKSKVVEALADIAFNDDEEGLLRPKVVSFPVPVAPDFIFERLRAQNGVFTIHGTNQESLDKQILDGSAVKLIKFVADMDKSASITNSLRWIVPSADSMFPDIDGIKDYIM
jgi:FRG domain